MVSGTGPDMLPSNLETQDILFRGRENQLCEALGPKSSKVRQVLLSASSRLLTLRLRILIVGPEYDRSLEIKEYQNPWELDPRPFWSLELLLAAFIEEGVRASGVQRASDWYKLAVIRVEQYNPHWVDKF